MSDNVSMMSVAVNGDMHGRTRPCSVKGYRAFLEPSCSPLPAVTNLTAVSRAHQQTQPIDTGVQLPLGTCAVYVSYQSCLSV